MAQPPLGPDAPEVRSSTGEVLAGALVVCVVLVGFFSMWWNRYLPPTTGGELTHAVALEQGRLPYRDFYCSTPPGSVAMIWAIDRAFGHAYVNFLAVGAALRLSGALAAYALLARFVTPATAAFAVNVTFIAASTDSADQAFFYHHHATVFSLFAALLAAASIEAPLRRATWLAAASGVIHGFTCCSKQTAGVVVGATLFTILLALPLHRGDAPRARRLCFAWLLGVLVPLAACAAWLVSIGAWGPFLDQAFLRGPSSKGGAGVAFVRPFLLSALVPYFRWSLQWALALLVASWAALSWSRRSAVPVPGGAMWMASVAVIGAMLVGQSGRSILGVERGTLFVLCYVSSVGSAALTIRLLARCLSRTSPPAVPQLAFLSAVAFGVAFSLSLSWPVFEVMIFPGATLVLALVLHEAAWRSHGAIALTVLVALSLALCVASTARKNLTPHSWGRWTEPPLSLSKVEPALPELRGLLVSPTTCAFLEDVVREILAHAGPDQTLLVYPNMPLFYGLSRRRPATFALGHWVDVCPDYVALADAERLLQAPPAVIVVHEDTEEEFVQEELKFRMGAPSAVRRVLAAIRELRPRYDLVATHPVPGHAVPVTVWALRR